MADTVTPKLGLTKPEIGASNNTWGTKWNGNADIIEAKMVRQSIQWTVTTGDDNPASTAGHFIITRYGNDTLRIDDPLVINRQSGNVTIPKINIPFSGAAPAAPPAGSLTIYADSAGNVYFILPSGVISFFGVPPGTVAYTAAASADTGYALCQGQAVNRAANPFLNARIGLQYGGDATNLLLPDCRGRTIAMIDTGTNRMVTAFNGAALGAAGGLDYHYLTLVQSISHSHGGSCSGSAAAIGAWPHGHNFDKLTGLGAGGGGPFGWASQTATATTSTDLNHGHGVSGTIASDAQGGSSWHPNAQPTICLNAQIKLG